LTFKHNGVVYVHGGISLEWAEKGKQYALDHKISSKDAIDGLNAWAKDSTKHEKFSDNIFRDGVKPGFGVSDDEVAGSGPLWNRELADGHCDDVDKILRVLGATKMVIGHTPQSGYGNNPPAITTKCGSKIIAIDVGISRGMEGTSKYLDANPNVNRRIPPHVPKEFLEHVIGGCAQLEVIATEEGSRVNNKFKALKCPAPPPQTAQQR
jgi:hypothetical protein